MRFPIQRIPLLLQRLELGAPHTVDLLRCIIRFLDLDLKPTLEWFPSRLSGWVNARDTHKPKSSCAVLFHYTLSNKKLYLYSGMHRPKGGEENVASLLVFSI